jgi:2-oxoglutarate dehydrogenase E1 component
MAGVDILAGAFNGANAAYIADTYARWARDPGSVDASFAELFAALNDEARAVLEDANGASWAPRSFSLPDEAPAATSAPKRSDSAPAAKPDAAAIEALVDARVDESLRAMRLVHSYRVRGHLEAKLDPLGLTKPRSHGDLDPATYGFEGDALDRTVHVGEDAVNLAGGHSATVRTLMTILRRSYCGPIGVEYMHMQDPVRKAWIQKRIEGAPWESAFTAEDRKRILRHLTEAEGFEAFCQKRFVGTKRFGLEGGEVTIAAMHAIIQRAAETGTDGIVIGMPHRGRLNTLVNIVRKPLVALFSEFAGLSSKPDDVQGSGDVKYHLGTSADVEIGGHNVHISLLPNPSHLEAVDPVVVGKVRASQDRQGDTRSRRSVMGILMHGDAAFAGQGCVYETLAMSQLIGYRTGGTIHVVVNNQIGFTTVPAHAYSGLYCTDVAKTVQSPILHVNGDEPEAVIYAAQLAAAYRQEFASDIVLDIVCYRRHGHNENDEPAFTQPTMYRAIRGQRTSRTLYAARLEQDGVVTAEEQARMWDEFAAHLGQAADAAKTYKPNKADWLEGGWAGIKQADDDGEIENDATAAPIEHLRRVGAALTAVPNDFDLNPKIARQLEAKRQAIDTGEGIDWATGEALAFGALLLDGHRVRLSGEDCQRGTFSQRHAVLIDQSTQHEYIPLNNIEPDQARFEVYNSLLSEVGVLGFEYGYTMSDPHTLVLWEAQFGDFANGAQVIIDQFLASGETKWLRMSGLTLLLPHGYEGQGPEHSSARLERYLQLCAERNMQVCNLTTPANYFHALRRQLKRNYRKPLVLMTPKSLLRHRLAVSTLDEMSGDSRFRPVIEEIDPIVPDDQVERVVVCSGKVYYDLLQARRDAGLDKVAIIRLEQIYPFPLKSLARLFARYTNAAFVWCQEEPGNMGAWNFVDRLLERALEAVGLEGVRFTYSGRQHAASPATGLASTHASEQAALVASALGLQTA